MAKRRAAAIVRTIRQAPTTIRVQMPRLAHAAKHHGKRLARRAGHHAYEERHRMGAFAGAGILGLIDKAGISVPTIPFLGKAGTLALAAWALGKYGKSQWANHACTGFGSIAIYELAKEGSISGEHGGMAAAV